MSLTLFAGFLVLCAAWVAVMAVYGPPVWVIALGSIGLGLGIGSEAFELWNRRA